MASGYNEIYGPIWHQLQHRSKDARLSFGMAVEVKPEEDGQSPRHWLASSHSEIQ